MADKKRLIDAKELAEKIWELRFLATGMRNGKTLLLEFAEKYRDEILRTICKAPTVDAVEVVRCKNCRDCEMGYPEKRLDREATQAWLCKRYKKYRKPDDFCSYGERKDNEKKAD